jgi:DNA-binding response OmpR family regulator
MANLLLVEDDLKLACAVHHELAQSGFDVTIATSPEAARSLGRSFDAGVFDLGLADECAVELALELVAAERVGRVLFFTGASWQPVLRRAIEVGPVIEKEQGPVALLAELRQPTEPPDDVDPASLADAISRASERVRAAVVPP